MGTNRPTGVRVSGLAPTGAWNLVSGSRLLVRVTWTIEMGEHKICHSSLLGQPAVVQLVDRGLQGKPEADKKEAIKKIATQCSSFDGKGKLTVDDLYSVIKVQCKVDVTKTDIRKVVADLPMDKNYKISIEDF